MLIYVVHDYIQPLEDNIVMVKEWIELHRCGEVDQEYETEIPDDLRLNEPFVLTNDPYAYPEGSFAHEMQLNTDFRMQRALEWEDLFLPYTTLLEAFPGLDPTKVCLRPATQLQFPNGIRRDVFNKEAEERGWHLMPSGSGEGGQIYPP